MIYKNNNQLSGEVKNLKNALRKAKPAKFADSNSAKFAGS
jgi:hypothetical protein